MSSSNYNQYSALLRKAADIRNAVALMHWDQEVNMPSSGAQFRAQQIATLSGMAHEIVTSSQFGEVLYSLRNDSKLSETEKRNIAESLHDYERNKKYPTSFIEEVSRTTSEAFVAWTEARRKSDFSIFKPRLEKVLQLKRQEVELLGYEDHPYDALLDQYEPGEKTKNIEQLFVDVRKHLVEFSQKIFRQQTPDDSFMFLHFPNRQQWEFSKEVLRTMHYDFNAGRLDLSAHPFSTSFSPKDSRITTRYDENNFYSMLWSTIHEGGHALYEQGLPDEQYGLPAGEAISLGIHESQSRLWENNIGRGKPFWKYFFPKLQEYFPQQFQKVSIDDFYKAVNVVEASPIRTEADEITYHFHVMVRFEIEKELITGNLPVQDLPQTWNSKYKEYLGIEIKNDAEGVLQDVHWSHGSIGYFPTYSLGSFYAAQFYDQMIKDILNAEQNIETGNFLPLLTWLRDNIHCYGKFYKASELCEKITGEKLQYKYFKNYVERKFGEIYNL